MTYLAFEAPTVDNETEAMILMLHHLKMAAALFEICPEIFPHSFGVGEFSFPAIEAWLTAITKIYKELDA